MVSVPFKSSLADGFMEVHGLMRWDTSSLHVQFDAVNALTGKVTSNSSFSIPAEQIDRVEFVNGWLIGGRLRVRVKDMQSIQQVSWRTGAEFEVAIARRNRKAAEEFAEEVSWSMP